MKFKDQFKLCYETTESLSVCHLQPRSGNIFSFNYMPELNLYSTNTQQVISPECFLKADKIISGVNTIFLEKAHLVSYICLVKLSTDFLKSDKNCESAKRSNILKSKFVRSIDYAEIFLLSHFQR